MLRRAVLSVESVMAHDTGCKAHEVHQSWQSTRSTPTPRFNFFLLERLGFRNLIFFSVIILLVGSVARNDVIRKLSTNHHLSLGMYRLAPTRPPYPTPGRALFSMRSISSEHSVNISIHYFVLHVKSKFRCQGTRQVYPVQASCKGDMDLPRHTLLYISTLHILYVCSAAVDVVR